ncbi:uncharacterized protein AB675_2482 [Cyphellophora attinorum]|uniref:Uncharacterized protein n=1 Tax=Cyphellophora attinorum TaxID=1664694 RepID=A0A0N1P364_9EURO|nr:uncharacterized protein AB675_2482 [Phialophora attinorum]KPI44857.1 hypothetical protein AB675_2482 [Phialophora attinorum]
MARLLDLALEVRNIIYHEVVRGARVRFALPGEKFRLSTCAALLVCCKQISAEFFPIFHEDVRINLSTKIDKKKGTIPLPNIRLDAIQHAKLQLSVFATDGGMIVLKGMTGLKSFTFPVEETFDIPSHIFECNTQPICHCIPESDWQTDWKSAWEASMDCPDCNEALALGHLQRQIHTRKALLVGKCRCNVPRDGYGSDGYECACSDNPIRKVIGAWEYSNQPFKLIAEAAIYDDTGFIGDWTGFFDLGAKEMVICDTIDNDLIIDEFVVDLQGY